MDETHILQERYVLEREIGRGGEGRVFLAFDLRLKKFWAVKKVSCDSREEEILKILEHPAFPGIVDVLCQDTEKYLVMDYIEGMTLEEMVKTKKVSWNQRLSWAIQICTLFEYLHGPGKGIIYQDIKPSNIMVQVSGTIKILDFGIADKNAAGKGSGYGTVGYAAPEQYHGNADIKSDIYGFGAVMKYMEPDSKKEYRVLGEWKRIRKKCMEQDRKKRYKSMTAIKRELLILKRETEGKRRVYTGTLFFAVGILFVLAGWMKRQETLMDLGGLLAGRKTSEMEDTADYEKAKAYFLKQKMDSETGEMYRILLETIDGERQDWSEARKIMEELGKQQDASWETVREQVFLANIYAAFGTEMGFDQKECLLRAVNLLEQAYHALERNSGEILESVYRTEILYQQAKHYAVLNENEKSIARYQKLLDEKLPKDVETDAEISLAYVYRRQKQYTLAADCYERLMKKYPLYGESYCAYALMLALEENKIPEAEEILKEMEQRGAAAVSFSSELVKNRIRGLEDKE